MKSKKTKRKVGIKRSKNKAQYDPNKPLGVASIEDLKAALKSKLKEV